MVRKVFYYHPAVVLMLIFSTIGSNCTKMKKPPIKYQYEVINRSYGCSYKEIKNSAFEKKIYKKTFAEVRDALVQIVSQRGAILEINQSDSDAVIVSGYGQFGTYHNTLIAIGIAQYKNRLTEVAAAWIDPQNSQCTEVKIDRDELLTKSFESFDPSQQRQALAFIVGSEFITQLSTQLYGPLNWHKKFW